MNWSYLKFVAKKNAITISFFIFLVALSFLVPQEFYGEDPKDVHILVLMGITLFSAVRSTFSDFISSAATSKPTSMKYLLSLNMSKKEFFINYCCSQFVLLLPCLISSLMAYLVYSNFESVLFSILKFAYIGSGLIFLISSAHFYKKFFIHKPGSFQEQYIKGKNAYLVKIIAVFFIANTVLLYFLSYSNITISFLNFDPAMIIGSILLGIIAIPFYWQLYVPVLALFVFFRYRSHVKAFNNSKFFQGKFRNEKKEKKIAFAMFAFCFLMATLDTPPPEFSGNKLTEAIYLKDIDMIKTYSTVDNLNKLSQAGFSPLSAAAYTGQWDVYEYLKKKGAKDFPEVTLNKKTYNMLELSIMGQEIKIIEDVLSLRKFDVNSRDKSGATPLHLAATNCRSHIAKALVENGADVNNQNNNGQTPLHLSIHRSCNDLGLVLLSLGADPTITDKSNKVALDFKKESLLPFLEEQLRRPASVEVDN